MIEHQLTADRIPSRVVVLGKDGFVASTLIRQLRERSINTLPISSKLIDLTERSSVDRLGKIVLDDDTVVFVSALTPDRGRNLSTFAKNLRMAEHVGAFLEQSKCGHLIYISSDAVYPDDAPLIRESSPVNPSGYHGLMHLSRERLLQLVTHSRGIPYLALRPTLLFGTNDTHNGYGPNRFAKQAVQEQRAMLFGQGADVRNHVYIHDMTGLTIATILRRSTGVLNIAGRRSLSFREIVDQIIQLRPQIELARMAQSSPVTYRHFDNTAITKAFPRFQWTPFHEALQTMLTELENRLHTDNVLVN